jgi:colanic acid biosynthesis glycosyl transferase WcaI
MSEQFPKVTIIGLNYAPEPSGIAPYSAGLAGGLADAGWRVRAITAFPHYPAWRISSGYSGRIMRQRIDGVQVTRLRPYMPANPSGFKRALLELSFGFKAAFSGWGKPDVVILVSPALFGTAIALIRARLTPQRPAVIVWVQDLYSLGVAETGALGARGARIMTAVESTVFRRADLVVAIHDRFRRYISSALGVPVTAIEVVRNWTHIRPIRVERDNYRNHFGWGDEVVVLHAGNMGAKQALENVVEAARLADDRGAAIRFVLLGDGNQREELQTLGQDIVRLTFLDSQSDEDFQGAMAAADILLVNEKKGVTEMAVPSKLTSYFASMRPVIVATDSGSISAEEVETAGAGVRVNAGRPAELLDAALELGSNRALGEKMGSSGARFQQKVLSQTAAISHYAEIIISLAGKRSR